MDDDSRIRRLVDVCLQSRGKFEIIEQFVAKLEDENGKYSTERHSENPITEHDIELRLKYIKRKIQKVVSSIKAFNSIATHLQSKYTSEIKSPPRSPYTGMRKECQLKLARMEAKNAKYDVVLKALDSAASKLSQRLDDLNERAAALHGILTDPIDDLKLLEITVSNIEAEVEDLYLPPEEDTTVSATIDTYFYVDYTSRKQELQNRLLDVIRQKAEFAMKMRAPFVAVHRARIPREPRASAHLVQKYEAFAALQDRIEAENRRIDAMILSNNTQRGALETSYDQKMKLITELTRKVAVHDEWIMQMHELNDRILTSREDLLILGDRKRDLVKQKTVFEKRCQQQEQASQWCQEALARVSRKQAEVEEKRTELEKRYELIEQMSNNVKLTEEQFLERDRDVTEIKQRCENAEKRYDSMIQVTTMQSDSFDDKLFRTASTRADSRQLFLNMLNTEASAFPDLELVENPGEDIDEIDELDDLMRQAHKVMQTPLLQEDLTL